VGVEAIGEEVGDVFLQEPNHGVLLPQYGRHPRTDAFERVLAASVVQETKDWLAQSKNRSPKTEAVFLAPNKRNEIVKNMEAEKPH